MRSDQGPTAARGSADRSLLAAALLALIGAAAHTFVGERVIFRRLPVESLPPLGGGGPRATSRYLRVVWHFFTAELLTTAVTLSLAAKRPAARRSRGALLLTTAHFVAYTGVTWSVARLQPRLLLRAPQWVVFLVIAILAARGTLTPQPPLPVTGAGEPEADRVG
jgi:hypothetical protein